ncbi:transmembrane anchor protein [Ruegeria arenilitoris]|uniref:transmembrane anchor protein n=1 Tax=Ruegeria arenilitoris TaxID=1173585 RepID=UPI00147AC168|nr:transmembrane anchor protein [Ruegeria arenilitoris]
MFNAKKPSLEELPSSAQLLKSTIIAAVSAIVILATIVLPAEYGIDPTRIGRVLGLAEMGEIKSQLAAEAEADKAKEAAGEDQTSLLDDVFGLFVGAAHAQTATPEWAEQFSVVLTPGEGTEVKLTMEEGAEVEFLWVAENGVVNFDLHGDAPGDKFISYEKGRGLPQDEDVLKAAFTGKHGWFWRNRDSQDVTVTLYVRGDYGEMLRP